MKRNAFNTLFPPVAKLSRDVSDFLEALLFTYPEDRHGNQPDWTIHEFHPEFIAAADAFLSAFRACLSDMRETAEDPDTLDEDATGRSYGGNVYFSLSGHGCGFWDDRDSERGKALQSALESFTGGDSYRFEEVDLMKFKGKLHLAFRTADFRREYTAKMFAYPVPATV